MKGGERFTMKKIKKKKNVGNKEPETVSISTIHVLQFPIHFFDNNSTPTYPKVSGGGGFDS